MSKSLEKVNFNIDKIKDKTQHNELIDLIDQQFETYKEGNDVLVRSKTEDSFLDYVIMGDQYFYDNWVAQFAIGNVGGRNYFDLSTWSDLTDGLTKGVIVVHEETKKYLFRIPKFIEPQYSEKGKAIISRISGIAGNAKFQQVAEQNETIKTLSEEVKRVSDEEKPFGGLTSLIPDHIYELYDIVPKAMQAVIYIRDNYNTLDNEEKSDKANDILKNYFKGQDISLAEKEFIWSLTEGDFYFGEENKKSVSNDNIINKQTHSDVYDPLSD